MALPTSQGSGTHHCAQKAGVRTERTPAPKPDGSSLQSGAPGVTLAPPLQTVTFPDRSFSGKHQENFESPHNMLFSCQSFTSRFPPHAQCVPPSAFTGEFSPRSRPAHLPFPNKSPEASVGILLLQWGWHRGAVAQVWGEATACNTSIQHGCQFHYQLLHFGYSSRMTRLQRQQKAQGRGSQPEVGDSSPKC